MQRRHAVVVGRVDAGPGPEQQADRLQIVPVRRPEDRRRPVRAARVDVDPFVEQRAHLKRVLRCGGADQPEILSGDR